MVQQGDIAQALTDVSQAFQFDKNTMCREIRAQTHGIYANLRILGYLVRIGNTRKFLNDAGAGFRIKAFSIAFFANLN